MSDHFVTDGSFINSIVGEGTEFRGDLKLNGLLRIDGDFSGSITTDGKILVGRNGRAECTITAGTVVVGGVVRGNISSSEKVIILSTGMVIGNVSTPRLIVEEGVVLNGTCLISKSAAASQFGGEKTGRAEDVTAETVEQEGGEESAPVSDDTNERTADAFLPNEGQFTPWKP